MDGVSVPGGQNIIKLVVTGNILFKFFKKIINDEEEFLTDSSQEVMKS